MNYVREVRAFYDWVETNGLDTSCIALWNGLMAIANKAGWPDEFAASRSLIEVKTGLKKDAQNRARNVLKQKGRIDFRSRGGNQSAVYRIIPFFASDEQTQNEGVSVIQTQNKIASFKPTTPPTGPPTQPPTQAAPEDRPVLNLNINKTTPEECILAIYARACPELPKVQVLDDALREKIRENWEEHPEGWWWNEFFDIVRRTDYLMGRAKNSTGWTASLPWLMDHVSDVMNGTCGAPVTKIEELRQKYIGGLYADHRGRIDRAQENAE